MSGVKTLRMNIAGVLIVEIAEMDALTRASPSAMKAFITRRSDRFRPPYGKYVINLKRQCVFTATINPPKENGRYLKDPTGARRILADRLSWHDQPRWPGTGLAISCGPRRCTGSREGERGASRPLNSRRWRPLSRRRASSSISGRTTIVTGWEIAPTLASWRFWSTRSGLPQKRHSQAAQTRIAKILKGRLGFTKHRPGHKERQNRYWREPSPAKS